MLTMLLYIKRRKGQTCSQFQLTVGYYQQAYNNNFVQNAGPENTVHRNLGLSDDKKQETKTKEICPTLDARGEFLRHVLYRVI